MRVLVIDNYDSFTYNLVQYLGVLGAKVRVLRNDAVCASEVVGMALDRLLISPGPGGPGRAGISKELIRLAAGLLPLLGVCLGHQCIAEVFGARVVRGSPVHGKTSTIRHDGRGIFNGLPSPLSVARYHSLVVEAATVPPELEVSAWTADDQVMGLRHRSLPVEGIQFHPESFMTEPGLEMLRSFLDPRFERRG